MQQIEILENSSHKYQEKQRQRIYMGGKEQRGVHRRTTPFTNKKAKSGDARGTANVCEQIGGRWRNS